MAELFVGTTWHPRTRDSGAGCCEYEIRAKTEQEPQQNPSRCKLLVADASARFRHLADHVDDRAGREREEQHRERRRHEVIADQRAEKRRPTTDQTEHEYLTCADIDLGTAQRCCDPETLSHVVQTEADDEQHR